MNEAESCLPSTFIIIISFTYVKRFAFAKAFNTPTSAFPNPLI